MSRSRAILLAGLAAGLLANYWVLEGVLADRSDPSGSWISDLGARSESTALVFDLLDAAAGLAVCVLALLLWGRLGDRSRRVRLGLIALFGVGICGIVDGAFPLSCAETLQAGCELGYDAVDVIHATENVVAILATATAFGLIGIGLRGLEPLSGLGTATLAIGAVWLLLTLLMASQFLIPGMDEVRGVFQRASQIVLGIWFVVLGAGISKRS